MQQARHGIGGQIGGHHADGLLLLRIEGAARLRRHGQHLVALQCAQKLAQRGLGAFAQLLAAGVFHSQRRLQAVQHGQQARSEAFNGELAALGNFFFGPAAGVLRLGLRAQGLVSQLGVFGLQGRQLGLQVFQLRQRISLIGRLRGFQLFRQHFARQAVFRVLIHGSFRK